MRYRALFVGLVAVGLLAGGLFIAGPAHAAPSGPCYGNPSRTCRPTMSTDWIPWESPTSPGSTNHWTITRGTRVNMQCWATGATRLGTSKWFKVQSLSYPYTRGFVPANAVAQQITVGRC